MSAPGNAAGSTWRAWLRGPARWLRGRDKGTVAVTFLLSLPVLLLVIGIIVQYALIANARLTIDRALSSAARTAVTALPVDPAIDPAGGPLMVERSLFMALGPISPAATFATSDAITVADSLQRLGLWLPDRYAERFSYAQRATEITILPIDDNGNVLPAGDYAFRAAPRARIVASYDLRLTVPAVNTLIGRSDTVGGVWGRYFRITASIDVQLSPGRQTPTSAGGEPS